MITATDFERFLHQKALCNLVIIFDPNTPAAIKQKVKDMFDPVFEDDDKEVAEEHWRAKDIHFEQTGDFKFLIYSNELYGACYLSKCFVALTMLKTEFDYIRIIDFNYDRDYDRRSGEVCGEYFYL